MHVGGGVQKQDTLSGEETGRGNSKRRHRGVLVLFLAVDGKYVPDRIYVEVYMALSHSIARLD